MLTYPTYTRRRVVPSTTHKALEKIFARGMKSLYVGYFVDFEKKKCEHQSRSTMLLLVSRNATLGRQYPILATQLAFAWPRDSILSVATILRHTNV